MILIFTKLKKYHSYTQQQSSFCFYYTLMYLFNSCFMIYIVHGQYPSQSNQLLLYDIHFVMLANAFSQPLFKLFDPIMWYKIIFKKYLKSLKPQRNPYTQMYIHKYYEGHQIQNGDNYQYIARILIVSIWFAHAAPLGVVFCLIGIVIDYWIGKIMLLRVYKKPQNISKSIAKFIINSIQLLPLVYICGVLQFTYKSTYSTQQQTYIQKNVYNHKNISIVQFLMNFFNYSITISVLIICILGYLIFFKTQLIVISKVSYSQNKKYFGFNYETQNPITKFRGQINYIQTVLKTIKKGSWLNVHSRQDMQIINQLTNISQSHNGINKIKQDVAKIKIKMASSKQYDDQDDNQIQLNDMSDKIKEQDQLRQSLMSSVQQKKPEKQKQINKNKFILRRTRSIFV